MIKLSTNLSLDDYTPLREKVNAFNTKYYRKFPQLTQPVVIAYCEANNEPLFELQSKKGLLRRTLYVRKDLDLTSVVLADVVLFVNESELQSSTIPQASPKASQE